MTNLYIKTPVRNYATALQAYAQNAIVYTCIRTLADGVASVPYMVRGNNSDLVLQLLNQPTPLQGGKLWRAALVTHLQTTGNAYILLLHKHDKTLPYEMHLLRADRVWAVTNRANQILYYDYQTDVDKVRYAASDIIHIKLYAPNSDIYGMAPIEAASSTIALHSACGMYQQALLNNAARPSGCLTYENGAHGTPLTDEQFRRLRDELTMHYTGAVNAGRPLLLEGGLTWKPMSFSPSDIEFTEARRSAARDIAAVFGVPPMLLGIPGDNTYANYQEAMRALVRNSIVPMADMIAQALTNRLQLYAPDIAIGCDTDQLPAYLPEREALWKRVSEADFLSTDEKRALLGIM